MEISRSQSELDPSSVLGFGAALALLDSMEGVAELLTGAVRSMRLADLQAVILDGDGEPQVVGRLGPDPLPESVVTELRAISQESSFGDGAGAHATQREVPLSAAKHSALAERGVERLSTIRLGTIDHDFGTLAVGLTGDRAHDALQSSPLQMMAAQASMALHRIRLDRQREAKEEALQASESRYRELYENAPVAYLSVDTEGTIHMANRRATDLLCASTDSLVGQPLTRFHAEAGEDARTIRSLLAGIEENRRLYDREVRIERADGTRIWTRTSIQPIPSSEAPSECLVTMIDITERVRMEEALREARDNLEDRVEERTAELEATNARLQKQAGRLATLRDIDQAILAAKSPDEIATAALRRVRHLMP
ncbi:MAG: PAS domain S-box protein, partial [Salinibacter sp.]